MRLRNVPGAREAIEQSAYVIQEETEQTMPGNWQAQFGNDHPVEIEVGMGKGQFILALAKEHPEKNFVGIEKFSSVLVRALQKTEEEELPNLRFIRMDAEEITTVFGAGEVDRIYLNFSDPWPKDRHAKRRLPSREFLARFAQILKADGTLEFKTDNVPLFDFALGEIEPAGWELLAVTRDLHHDPELSAGNIMTEYEERFSRRGNRICKLIIRPGAEKNTKCSPI